MARTLLEVKLLVLSGDSLTPGAVGDRLAVVDPGPQQSTLHSSQRDSSLPRYGGGGDRGR